MPPFRAVFLFFSGNKRTFSGKIFARTRKFCLCFFGRFEGGRSGNLKNKNTARIKWEFFKYEQNTQCGQHNARPLNSFSRSQAALRGGLAPARTPKQKPPLKAPPNTPKITAEQWGRQFTSLTSLTSQFH
jgi:hypothetical protein